MLGLIEKSIDTTPTSDTGLGTIFWHLDTSVTSEKCPFRSYQPLSNLLKTKNGRQHQIMQNSYTGS